MMPIAPLKSLQRRALRTVRQHIESARPDWIDPGRERARPAYAGQRTYAFVTGCSRSGTSALTELVNRHPDVAIGFERFWVWGRDGRLTPELYEPDRFRDFREGDGQGSAYAGKPKRQHVLHKIHAAKVVGDKIPHIVSRLDQLDDFPNARVIFIVREPFGVAKSFDARAAKGNDSWAPERDFRAAIEEFNEAMASILAYAATGKPYLLLDYAGLFLRREGLDDIWTFLGVDRERLPSVEDIFSWSTRRADASRTASIAREVSLKVDFGALHQVLSLDRMRNRSEIMKETSS